MCLKEIPRTAMKEENNKYQAWKTANSDLLTFFFVRIPLPCSLLLKNLGSKLYLSCVLWRTVSRWENVSIKHLRTLEFELITMSLHWNILSHEYVYKSMSFRCWKWTWMKMSQLVYCAGKTTYTNTQQTKYRQIHVGNFREIWLQWRLVHLDHKSYFRHQSGHRSNIFFNFRFILRTIFQDGCTTSREKGEGSSQVRNQQKT